DERRAFSFADLDVLHDRLQLRLADRRSHLCSIEPIANTERTGSCGELLQKYVVDFLMHDDTARRGTTLTACAESTPQTAFDGKLELRVVHDDDDVLAAHLEVVFLERRCRILIDETADRCRARERDDLHLVVRRHARADVGPTGDQIHDARWN